jgi:hypothetical protein
MHARRWAAAVVLTLVVSMAAVPGFAASLRGLVSKKLGAGSAVVSACDTNGFAPSYTTVSGSVTAVTVSGIADPGCEGGTLAVTLANAGGTSIGASTPQVIAVDAGVVDNVATVSLSPTPAASLVAAIHVSVTGP